MLFGFESLVLAVGLLAVYFFARRRARQVGWIAALRPYVWFHFLLLINPPLRIFPEPPESPSFFSLLLFLLSALFLAYICRYELDGKLRYDFLLTFKYSVIYYISICHSIYTSFTPCVVRRS